MAADKTLKGGQMQYRITNARTGEVVAEHADLAQSPLKRMKGLLGKKGLALDEAIILRPASSIHTVFMRFAIDVIYVDRDNKVVKVVRDLVPYRFSAAKGAKTVIEMMTGATNATDLQPGDQLVMTEQPS
jgi:uncharacterized protein